MGTFFLPPELSLGLQAWTGGRALPGRKAFRPDPDFVLQYFLKNLAN
jgi:hypothetical protein